MMPSSTLLIRCFKRALGSRHGAGRGIGLVLALAAISLSAQARDLPVLTLSVLQFGTPHWELEHLKRQQLDRANGFELKIRLAADVPASRLALSSGSVDGAVSDLLWAQARYEAGTAYRYVPFSSQIGEVLVPDGSDIRTLADLRGKRIGVAGGPDGLGWRLLQRAAAAQGLDLAREATVQYAAPPLLGQALRRGQVDALLTFWHFSARLRGEGGGMPRSAWPICSGHWTSTPGCRCSAICSRKPGPPGMTICCGVSPAPCARPRTSWRASRDTGRRSGH